MADHAASSVAEVAASALAASKTTCLGAVTQIEV